MESYIDYCDLGFRPVLHHKLLISQLEAVQKGEVERLMVCMPPGSAKSTYASVVFPAWYLGKSPLRSIIGASNTQDLAETFGRRVRNLFASPEHQNVFPIPISTDTQAAGHWGTSQGGEYYAAGVGSSIVGRRGDLGIIDDPVKSREDADSDRSRQRAWEWYVHDFLPRLKPNAAQILVMTRWHEDDLGGRILAREASRWRLIELPMEAMGEDLLGRQAGERLWPEWFTEEMVSTAKLDVRAWNALYQQQPAAEEGDYFKLDWFQEYEFLPDNVVYYGASDYAVTEGGGDYTEHGIFAVDAWANIYVVDWWRGQTAADKWIDQQCNLILEHEPLGWFGEAGPIRRAVEPFMLRRMTERKAFARIEWLPSIADKPTRCRAFQAVASMGKVFMPKRAAWKADLLGQLTRFPAGRHDDGVDVCSLIGRGLEYVKAPRFVRQHAPARPLDMSGEPGRSWLGV
jgi:predicted phage terminase large subunit-like protein